MNTATANTQFHGALANANSATRSLSPLESEMEHLQRRNEQLLEGIGQLEARLNPVLGNLPPIPANSAAITDDQNDAACELGSQIRQQAKLTQEGSDRITNLLRRLALP